MNWQDGALIQKEGPWFNATHGIPSLKGGSERRAKKGMKSLQRKNKNAVCMTLNQLRLIRKGSGNLTVIGATSALRLFPKRAWMYLIYPRRGRVTVDTGITVGQSGKQCRPGTSWRQWSAIASMPTGHCLVVPSKCSSRNWQFPHRVVPFFAKEKMPWCPCYFKNEIYVTFQCQPLNVVLEGMQQFLSGKGALKWWQFKFALALCKWQKSTAHYCSCCRGQGLFQDLQPTHK